MSRSIAELKKQAKAEAAAEIAAMRKRAASIPANDEVDEEDAKPTTTAMRPTVTSRRHKRSFIMPDAKPKAQKGKAVPKDKAPKRATEAMILAKYPHAIKGTLDYDETHSKQSIEAKLECGHRARIFTSDLFQVKRCHDCRKARTAEKVARLAKQTKEKQAAKKKAAVAR